MGHIFNLPIVGLRRVASLLAALLVLSGALLALSKTAHGSPRPRARAGAPNLRLAWLGVDLSLEKERVVVTRVLPGSPAERAGLQAGDVVHLVGGQATKTPLQVIRAVAAKHPGEQLALGLRRGDTLKVLSARLGERPEHGELLKKIFVGQEAPSLERIVPIQGFASPAELTGKVRVIEFWASWCSVCHHLIPRMNTWHRRYAARDVHLVGVTSEAGSLAAQSVYRRGMKYPVAADRTGATQRAYRVSVVPALYLVDREGVVRDVMVGYSRARLREFEQAIETLIAKD